MGRHHFDLQNCGKALKNFDRALQIYQNTTIDSNKKLDPCFDSSRYWSVSYLFAKLRQSKRKFQLCAPNLPKCFFFVYKNQ